tara:strand:- start:1754 stop:2923 length:1170 start_codon:yes stop_codon:yes gene_type:complete
MSKVMFFGYATPLELFEKDQSFSSNNYRQTFNFSHAFLNFLLQKELDVVNVAFSPVIIKINRLIRCFRFSPANVLMIEPIRFIYFFVKSIYKLCLNRPSLVFVHGLYLPVLVAVIVYSFFSQVDKRIILTDKVNLGDHPSISGYFRLVNNSLIRFFVSFFDSSVSLTKPLSDLYLPNKGSFVFPGFFPTHIFDQRIHNFQENIRSKLGRLGFDEFRVYRFFGIKNIHLVYSGGLEKAYGVLDFYSIFKKLAPKNVILSICGSGPLEKFFTHESSINPNFYFLGQLNGCDLFSLYENTTAFVNPRPVDLELTSYSSPSKIFEYACFDKPIMTTKLPGLETHIPDFLVFFDDDLDFTKFLNNVNHYVNRRNIDNLTSINKLYAGIDFPNLN